MGQKTEPFDERLRELFGTDARSEGPLASSGAGRRFTGIDLCRPLKSNINSLDDARLLYRLSCKGEPALSLPRRDAPEWRAAHIPGGYATPPEVIDIA